MNKIWLIGIVLFLICLVPTSANAAINDSLEHCWNLDSSGVDEIGGLTMTAVNGATYTTADQILGGGAALCDGSNDYFTFGDTNDWADDYSVNVWVRPHRSGTEESFLSLTGEHKTWFNHTASNNTGMYWNDAGGTWHGLVGDMVAKETWYMITVTRNDTANEAYLYVDGVLADTESFTSEMGATTKTNSICARENPWASWDQYFDGNIDDLAIWDRVLTAEEIEEIYYNGTGLMCPVFADPEDPEENVTAGNFSIGTCPIENTPQVLMMFLMAGIMIAMIVISETIIKIDFFTFLAGIGITFIGFLLFACSLAVGLLTVGMGCMLSIYALFLKK